MRRLIFSERARRELASIRNYIALDAPVAATRLVERLGAACEQLPNFPLSGREGHVAGTRELVTVRPYIIVYSLSDDTVEVVQIVHAAQDR